MPTLVDFNSPVDQPDFVRVLVIFEGTTATGFDRHDALAQLRIMRGDPDEAFVSMRNIVVGASDVELFWPLRLDT